MSLPSPEPSDLSHLLQRHPKVGAIFLELAAEPMRQIVGVPIIRAVTPVFESEFGFEKARDIGFHLADWIEDAQFLVALHLFPDRFTPEEIKCGVMDFLIHAPNHVAAAAALSGCPIEDIFEVGALDGPQPDEEPPCEED